MTKVKYEKPSLKQRLILHYQRETGEFAIFECTGEMEVLVISEIPGAPEDGEPENFYFVDSDGPVAGSGVASGRKNRLTKKRFDDFRDRVRMFPEDRITVADPLTVCVGGCETCDEPCENDEGFGCAVEDCVECNFHKIHEMTNADAYAFGLRMGYLNGLKKVIAYMTDEIDELSEDFHVVDNTKEDYVEPDNAPPECGYCIDSLCAESGVCQLDEKTRSDEDDANDYPVRE